MSEGRAILPFCYCAPEPHAVPCCNTLRRTVPSRMLRHAMLRHALLRHAMLQHARPTADARCCCRELDDDGEDEMLSLARVSSVDAVKVLPARTYFSVVQ